MAQGKYVLVTKKLSLSKGSNLATNEILNTIFIDIP